MLDSNLNAVSYLLQTTALKSGALHHDIHYWLGKDTSQVSIILIILTLES